MKVLIAHHGHCFDGAVSAALFSRFYREVVDASAAFSYKGLVYEPNAAPTAERLREDSVNVIVDFRYTRSPQLEWYFDHHVSAFQEAGSREHFAADQSGKKFHDGQYGSCTRLIADVLRDRHGWQAPDMADLIEWADIVDAARFPNADVASGLDHPALEITAVVQEQGDENFCSQLIPRLTSESMSSVAASPLVSERLGPIRQRLVTLTDRMARLGEQRGYVAYFDLSDAPLESVSKFLGYKLFPTASYSVVLSCTPRRIKISVGFNPWSARPRVHNIATICEAYGGGGHPVVGAVSFAPGQMPAARKAVSEIIELLSR